MTLTTTQKNRDRAKSSEQGENFGLQTAFAEKAQAWAKENVKYRHRGTTKRGCDCTGLLIGIARELGFLRGYKVRMYPQDWNLHSGASGSFIINELEKFGYEIPNNEIVEGDVVVFRFGKCIAHAGILVNRKSRVFVHSFLTAGKCQFAILKDSIWSKRWVKSYRLNNEKMVSHN